mmetsp:Transcript_46187/g.67465  ORF Transcript_46187/g.67465 Transcript_46187/m.67465 type:complete len:86 (-) Transcript_46187:83-340(-)
MKGLRSELGSNSGNGDMSGAAFSDNICIIIHLNQYGGNQVKGVFKGLKCKRKLPPFLGCMLAAAAALLLLLLPKRENRQSLQFHF